MTPNPIVKEYEYRPRLLVLGSGILFFGVLAVAFAHWAIHNDRGLIINGLIELSQANATIFYWVFSGLSGLFVLASLAMGLSALVTRKRIAFSSDSIFVPQSSWSSHEVTIPFTDIASITTQTINGQSFLYIYRGDGKKFTILAQMLASKHEFDEIAEMIAQRMRASKTLTS